MAELFHGVDGPIDVISEVGRMGILNLREGTITLGFDPFMPLWFRAAKKLGTAARAIAPMTTTKWSNTSSQFEASAGKFTGGHPRTHRRLG